MRTKSQDRKHGNDGNQYPRRKARFTSGTTGIRLPDDLRQWSQGELAKNPEETFSLLVREGLRLLKKKREGLIQVLSPVDR